MSIQAKIIENPSKTNDFPKLMRRKKSGGKSQYIVLFLSIGNGFIVSHNGGPDYPFGQQDHSWNIGAFEEFDGTVELKNG